MKKKQKQLNFFLFFYFIDETNHLIGKAKIRSIFENKKKKNP